MRMFPIMLVLLFLSFVGSARAAIPASERMALMSLYQSTNGDSWSRKDNWNGPPGTECTWFGVGCDTSSSTVVWIDLEFNGLTGTLSDLSGLVNLQEFYVSQNRLTGSIPQIDMLTNLTIFDAHQNQLTGSLPTISALTNLQSFRVNSNQLSGPIPAIAGMANLRTFFLGNNQFAGSLPSTNGLVNLRAFSAGANRLTGAIPTFPDSPNLAVIELSRNQLTGTIPNLAAFPLLNEVDLSGNALTGALPPLGSLPQLQYFNTSNNRLTGELPSLANLANLSDFEVSNNQLTGSISSFASLPNIRTFYVDGNQLTGALPAAPWANTNVCPNALTPTPDPAWDSSTGVTPWYAPCVNPPLTVTPIAGPHGTISPNTSVIVQSGRKTSFFITPDAGYIASVGGTCGGPYLSVIGYHPPYTTNPVFADCTVKASFIPIPYPTQMTLVASADPALTYQNVTFTATLDAFMPTGTVTFTQGARVLCQSVRISSATTQNAACAARLTSPGVTEITATFTGDTNNAPATAKVSIGVLIQPSLSLESFANPSHIGQAVTFQFGRYSSLPAGETLTLLDGQNILCVVPFNNAGNTCTTASLTVGTHNITVNYSGDATHTAATASLVQLVSASLLPTTMKIQSANGSPALLGHMQDFQVVLYGSYLTGSVSVYDNDQILCTQTIFLEYADLAQVDCWTSLTSKGYHTITAIYSGDVNNAPVSGSIVQAMSDSLAPSTMTINTDLPTSSHGQAVTFSASVTGNAPTGSIAFSNSDGPMCNAVVVATAANTASASCTATLPVTFGNFNSVHAYYSGDINNYWSWADTATTVNAATGRFVSLEPARLLDTRAGGTTADGMFGGIGGLGAGSFFGLSMLDRVGIPATGVSAVAFNLTATSPTANGYLTAWPSGQPLPFSSNLNFTPGATVPNLAIVAAGTAGGVSLYNSAGSTDLVADAVGYFTTGSELNAIQPQRILDTRRIGQTIDGRFKGIGALSAGATIHLTLAGRAGVPDFGAGVAIMNVTATNTTKPGFITAFAGDAPQPLASSLNFTAAQTIANLVVTPIGANGQVSLYNSAGNTDLIADLMGWMPTASQLTAIAPARLMDTRPGTSTIDGQFLGTGPISAENSKSLLVAGRAGMPSTGVDSVVLNVTVTDPTAAGYVTVWPTGSIRPIASNLNFVPGQTVPNLVIAKLGPDGTVSFFNSAGTTNLVVDVVGWFAKPNL